MRTFVIAVAVVAIAACATGPKRELDELADRERSRPEVETIQAAVLYGEQYGMYYRREGLGFRNRRRAIDIGLLIANTFVVAASGLEAHPDTVFAGALAASTIHDLDPVINAGGPEAWSAAYATNLCVLQVARGANTGSLSNDYMLLQAIESGAGFGALRGEISQLLARYRRAAGMLQSSMDRAFTTYVRETTPDLLNVNDVANGVLQSRTARQAPGEEDPAAAALHPMNTSEFNETLARGLSELVSAGAGPAEADVHAAMERISAALDVVEADTPKCFPAPSEQAQQG
jgi:hypothetical protein